MKQVEIAPDEIHYTQEEKKQKVKLHPINIEPIAVSEAAAVFSKDIQEELVDLETTKRNK